MRKLKKGDTVVVIAGKDKGKKGTILNVLIKEEKVIVDGVNVVKRHTKANPNAQSQGGRLDKTMPIHWSNIMLIDPTTQKGSRVGMRLLEDGKRVRYFKTSDQIVDVKGG